MGVGARDVLELRPQPSHVATMNLSDAEFIELGMGSKDFMSAVGYNYRSMREHRFTLRQWSHVLGDAPDWLSLGFRDFDECAAVWDPDELFTLVFATQPAGLPAPAPLAPLPDVPLRHVRLKLPGIE